MDSYIVAYDISEPRRLRQVATACEDFGVRRQYSVFFCRLSATDLVRLRSRLYDIIDLSEDQVLFIPLCGKCVGEIEALGPDRALRADRLRLVELSSRRAHRRQRKEELGVGGQAGASRAPVGICEFHHAQSFFGL